MTPALLRDPLLAGWQSSPFRQPAEAAVARTLAVALAEQTAKWPDSPAIIYNGQTVTFSELSVRVGGLAAQIAQAAAEPGPVALIQSLSVDVVVAWFACGLAGRAFLLLEDTNPPERNRALMKRAGVRILLSERAPDLSAVAGIDHLTLLQPDGRLATMDLAQGLDIDAPAGIFPTSGSTGEPKLIAYSSRTLQAKLQASMPLMGITAGDRVLIAASHCNFGFLHHALVFILSGGTVCLADVRHGGLSVIFDTILKTNVRHLRFTPSLFRVAIGSPAGPEALRLLRGVRFTGEPLLATDLDIARRVLNADCCIQNIYGSTESGLFVWTDDRSSARLPDSVPIGLIYPLWEFSIREDDGAPVEFGELGELVISSEYQALGDWHCGAIDNARFPPDPRDSRRRLYRTGDIVRQQQDGSVLVAGRKDRLVKINGQRVSLLEVEAALQAMPGCSRAAVVPFRLRGNTRHAAFLVPDNSTDLPADPGAWLAQHLPRWMVPNRFVVMADLPLLPSGKIDGQSLVASLAGPETDPASRVDLTAVLTEIWTTILDITSPRPNEDFFALGGDSLDFLRLLAAIETRFGRHVVLPELADGVTIESLAQLLAAGGLPVARQECLVPLVAPANSSQLPFYCVHAGGGGIDYMLSLAGRMNAERPFHALRNPPDLEANSDIVGLAARYAAAIVQSQPSGPYLIGGYSFGAIVAYEIACQLQANGHQIALLLVIDQPWPAWRITLRRLPATLLRLARNAPRVKLLSTLAALARFPLEAYPARWKRHQAVPAMTAAHLLAVRSYRPVSTRIPVAVIAAKTMRPGCVTDTVSLGWEHVAAAPPEVRLVSGTHLTLFSGNQVTQVAALATELLAKADRPRSG